MRGRFSSAPRPLTAATGNRQRDVLLPLLDVDGPGYAPRYLPVLF